jgi:hypothetical protein
MTSETKKHNQLKGRENYLPWLTRMEALLTIDDVLKRNTETDTLEIIGSTDTIKLANEKKAMKYVIQNCDDSVMHSINPSPMFDSTKCKSLRYLKPALRKNSPEKKEGISI